MRKVKLQMQVTADGFVCGPNGEMDWIIFNWDDTLKNYVIELTASVDTMVMGRVLYQGMSQYWPAAAADKNHPENEFAHIMNNMPKVVFSNTLTTVEWNARLAEGNIEEEVTKLKQQQGKDMIIYGGVSIVSSFIKQNLIDEYHLFVNPVAIGNGKSIFKELVEKRNLKLKNSITSSTGIVVLCYEPAIP